MINTKVFMSLKPKNDPKSSPMINEALPYDKMQVITNDGRNMGVISRSAALKLAQEAELDLVLLSEQGGEGAPVVKIMDFGKALYAKKKQVADSKKHQKVIQVKEIKLRPKIGEHDFQTKINQAVQFLQDGKHLKVTLMFKGREAINRDERGQEMFDKIHASFEQAGLTKLASEKDAKTSQMWTRIYYTKK